MSEASKSNAVLLPSATVDVFAVDEDTQKKLGALTEDWRFARVNLTVEMGGMDAAIEKYKEYSSPDLIIIGTDDISDGFTDRLGDLSEHCVEGTEAVIIGPKNDVTLYRDLVGMGVRDYLVRPVEAEVVVDVIAKTLFDKIGVSDSRLVAVIGAKGGVGTTSVAQMLAWDISEEFSLKTMLMDAAGGWSTLGLTFGIESAGPLAEGLRYAKDGTDDDLKRMMSDVSDHLTVFACSGDELLSFTPEREGYEKAIDRIMKTYPVVVVDLSHAPHSVAMRMIERAHEVLVVTTPGLTSLRSARTLLKEIKGYHGDDSEMVDLIVNMKGKFGNKEISEGDIETALDHEPSCFIPYLPHVFSEAESTGQPLAKVKDGQELPARLMDVAKHASAYKGDLQPKAEQQGSLLDKMMASLKKSKE